MNIDKIRKRLAAFEAEAAPGIAKSLEARRLTARDMRELIDLIDLRKGDATPEELRKLGAWGALAV